MLEAFAANDGPSGWPSLVLKSCVRPCAVATARIAPLGLNLTADGAVSGTETAGPRWLVAALKAGGKVDDFRIPGSDGRLRARG